MKVPMCSCGISPGPNCPNIPPCVRNIWRLEAGRGVVVNWQEAQATSGTVSAATPPRAQGTPHQFGAQSRNDYGSRDVSTFAVSLGDHWALQYTHVG